MKLALLARQKRASGWGDAVRCARPVRARAMTMYE